MNSYQTDIRYSIVVPVLNEEEVLEDFYKRLILVMDRLNENYEVLFVNDGSTDRSLEVMKDIQAKDKKIRIIDFSRNFGHQIAVTAGTDYSKGDAIIVIDADLQDPPEVIPSFIKKWKEGFEVVYGVREVREGETIFKKITANIFYRTLRRMAKIDIPVDAGDFRLIDKKVVEVFKRIREQNRYVRGLVSWVGFKQIGVSYKREKRFAGKTKYSLTKMVKLAIDGVISFSSFPLKIATYLGFFTAGASFLYIIYALALRFLTDKSVPGWTSLMVAILFLGGIQLICLGILGEYIGRINEETKNRPLYIIKRIFD